jgi:SAM-dependent methyltransferase
MGVSLIPAAFLLRNACHVAGAGRGLVLGRQKLSLRGGRMRRFLDLAAGQGLSLAPGDIGQADGFTESFFRAIGYPPMTALDFTDAEGAGIVHDLNLPLPARHREGFDLVIDGGTSEHVFHIGQALDTCHELLRPGGVMMAYVSCDGWFGHGFFQTGPDVPWRYWHHARGYEMLEVSIVARRSPASIRAIPDPTGRPRGGELALSGPHMLLYAARKPLVAPPFAQPVQGHYARGEDDET